MSDNLPTRDQIRIGCMVEIETKKNQKSGMTISGAVRDILTSSRFHPHGIKVRLEDGQVGRVKRISDGISTGMTLTQQDFTKVNKDTNFKFEDLGMLQIPKTEDQYNEFKEFYQYDPQIQIEMESPSPNKQTIDGLKRTIQERLAVAVCAFGNRSGGFVFLGIYSDGNIMGLERDRKFGQFDDYNDSFANHIRDRLGEFIDYKSFIVGNLQIVFRKVEDKTICIIQVLPASQPLFLKTRQGDAFYVRGPTPRAEKLEGRDQFQYIKRRFPEYG